MPRNLLFHTLIPFTDLGSRDGAETWAFTDLGSRDGAETGPVLGMAVVTATSGIVVLILKCCVVCTCNYWCICCRM